MLVRDKAISGLIWNSFDSFANQGVQLGIGIFLARILSPREFGLMGMLTIFIAVSQSLIDSGFSSALIRKKDCTQEDYSTIFYFNLVISIALYFLLFLLSGTISSFFNEPQLKILITVLGIALVLNSFTIIQRTKLTKELNFKIQMYVSTAASVISGIIAIVLALNGFGVWSLVALTLCRVGLTSLFFWIWSKWRPVRVFSKKSFYELFSFGSKLLISGLIDTIYRNVYNLVIGKYFSAVHLGYYAMADQLQALPSQNLSGIIGRVSYPVLSKIQDDASKLKTAYQRLIKSTMLVSFLSMFMLAAIAEPMITAVIGAKWLPSVLYLQLLCFVGMIYPLHALNLNILQLKGRSDLFLRLEIQKKILIIPVIFIGIFWGISIMIVGMIIINIIAFYLNSYWAGEFINYSTLQQLRDIFPSFLIGLIIGVIVFALGHFLPVSSWLKLSIQILSGLTLTIGLSESIKLVDYFYIKGIIFEKLFKKQ